MAASRKNTAHASPDDDIPDMTAPVWAAKIAAAKVKRGRPRAEVTKASQTIRMDRDVLDAYKAAGAGWQTRMNDVLRKGMPKAAKRRAKTVA